MEIKTGGSEVKLLEEYDFIFTNGNILPITLDLYAGDTIEFTPDVITIKLVSKPSVTDPKGEIGDNTTMIYRTHLMFYEHRQRKQLSITAEQRLEFEKTIKSLAGKGERVIH